MKILNIFYIILIGIIFTSCSDKQKVIEKKPAKVTTIKKKIDNYKEALTYEDKNGYIKGNSYSKYKYYLDKAIEEKNPNAYVKAYNDYQNPIGKKAYIDGKYIIVSKANPKKANLFAILAIENRKSKKIACNTIKKIGKQYLFDEKQSYRIYLANKNQGCINIQDKNFDFKFTPTIVFINKTLNNPLFYEKRMRAIKQLINDYSKKAIDGNLDKEYARYDDRWVLLSKMSIDLAILSYKNDNKDLTGTYLALAKKIIEATPLNEKRYHSYDFKARDKIIKEGSDKILKALLKII